ncbi:MAG: alpha/beta hydrolase, partial [Candidatus Kapabacteria bacterium]|nr:alpha/beta hydrolase [Candidatus Kapabacteria bacterium]
MNTYKIALVLFLFIALCVNTFSQATTNSFEVKVSGNGSKSIIFIPGFSCSGEVWDETKAIYEEKFKCHVLTMAGFAGAKPQSEATFKIWETSIA